MNRITRATLIIAAAAALIFWVIPEAGAQAPTITSFTPTSGPVGTTVSITGTGFTTGTTSVSFNGTFASFSVVSDTEIRTIVPAGATTGPINVTTFAGTATSVANFTVLVGPGPKSFSIKCVLHIVVTDIGLVGKNGIAGMDCETDGPVKIQEVKATAEITGPQNLRIAWAGEVSFTEPVSGFWNVAGNTNPEFLPLNIQSFETKLATVSKLPGFDFSLAGAAGINPDAIVGLEVSGNTNPEA
jgi:hypothetical protein